MLDESSVFCLLWLSSLPPVLCSAPFDVNLHRRSSKSMKMVVKSRGLVSVAAVLSIKCRLLLSSPGFPRSLCVLAGCSRTHTNGPDEPFTVATFKLASCFGFRSTFPLHGPRASCASHFFRSGLGCFNGFLSSLSVMSALGGFCHRLCRLLWGFAFSGENFSRVAQLCGIKITYNS